MTTQSTRRLNALRAAMAKHDVDLIAVGPGPHMYWLMGFYPHPDERPCLLLVSKSGETFLMPALNAEGSREHTDVSFHNWDDADGPQAALASALSSIDANGSKQVALDETMRADFALLLLDNLPGARHQFCDATLGALRMRKDDGEYAQLKENALIADRAMQAGFAAIKPGVTENSVASIIREHFSGEGATPLFSIVATGGNGAFPHHMPGESVLKAGDAIVIDIGARKGDFSSDITRMVAVGGAPEGYDEVHAIVDQAVEAAMQAARPGVAARDVDLAARQVISDAGYGEYFVHRLGHGLGLEAHEQPYLTSTSETVLDAGMTFSIEPGIYLPGRFGIRLEEIVILRDDGPEILSSLPRTLHIAGA